MFLNFVGLLVLHLLAQNLLNFSEIEQFCARVETHGHITFQILLHLKLLSFMVFLHLQHLLGDGHAETFHPIVPLQCKFLKFFTVIKLDLLRLMFVLLKQTVLNTFLSMLSYNLNILKLCVSIYVLTQVCMIETLFVKLVDKVAHIIYKLLLLNDRLRSLYWLRLILHHSGLILSRIYLLLLSLLHGIIFIIGHIILWQLLHSGIILIDPLLHALGNFRIFSLNFICHICIWAFLELYHVVVVQG